MATVIFTIRANRADFIRAGADPATKSLAVNLAEIDAEGRELLASYAEANDALHPVEVSAPTVQALLGALADQRVVQQEKAAQEDNTRRALIAELRDVIADRKTRERQGEKPSTRVAQARKALEGRALRARVQLTLRTLVSFSAIEPDWPWQFTSFKPFHLDEALDGTDGQAWLAELDCENQERFEAAEAAEIRRLGDLVAAGEAALAAAADGLSRLKQWGLDSGSERVRLLIEEDHPGWESVCADEFLEVHTPDGYEPMPTVIALPAGEVAVSDTDVKDRTKPQAADIHALRSARALCAASPVALPAAERVRQHEIQVLSEPELAWVVLTGTAGEWDSEPWEVTDKWAGVGLTVTAPNGASRTAWHRVEPRA